MIDCRSKFMQIRLWANIDICSHCIAWSTIQHSWFR